METSRTIRRVLTMGASPLTTTSKFRDTTDITVKVVYSMPDESSGFREEDTMDIPESMLRCCQYVAAQQEPSEEEEQARIRKEAEEEQRKGVPAHVSLRNLGFPYIEPRKARCLSTGERGAGGEDDAEGQMDVIEKLKRQQICIPAVSRSALLSLVGVFRRCAVESELYVVVEGKTKALPIGLEPYIFDTEICRFMEGVCRSKQIHRVVECADMLGCVPIYNFICFCVVACTQREADCIEMCGDVCGPSSIYGRA